MNKIEYSPSEAMVIYGARYLKDYDNKTGLMGIGLPFLVARVAKELYKSNFKILIEEGEFDSGVIDVPLTTCDNRLVYKSSLAIDTKTALSRLMRGKVDFGFIGGAQVDMYGNINSTTIGDFNEPKQRLAGSGGAVDIAGFTESIIMMAHEKRRIVEKVDYLTSPGWYVKDFIDGEEKMVRREGMGLKTGPSVVITSLGVMRFDDETKKMYAQTLFPGVTPQDVIDNTGFDIDVSRAVVGEEITQEELRILREIVDPTNIYKTRK